MHENSLDSNLAVIKKWLGSGSINIFGVPFAGKDTQSKRLAELLGAEMVGSGDLLRNHQNQEKIKELMSSGELFPTDFYLNIILPFLSKAEFHGKPLVLSSVGRWSGEEKVVLKAAETAGHPIKAVVLIELDDELVHKRFEMSQHLGDRGQRHDDAMHLIEVRLSEFKQKTLPVIAAYKDAGLLVEVEGNQPLDKVTEEIITALAVKTKN